MSNSIVDSQSPYDPPDLATETTDQTLCPHVPQRAKKVIVSRTLMDHSNTLICFECGELLPEEELIDLQLHVHFTHEITIEEYEEKHGPVEVEV